MSTDDRSPRATQKFIGRPIPRLLAGAGLAAFVAALALSAGAPASEAASATYTIWPDTAVPAHPADPDTSSVEIGTVFSSTVSGTVSSIRFYKSASNRGTHVGKLWSASGALATSVSFTQETSAGWQVMKLAKPLAIAKGAKYTVSYNAPSGHYAGDQFVFSGGKTVTHNALTAFSGVYNYSSGVPKSVWNGANYYVDVVFTPASSSVTPPPTTPTPPPTSAPAAGTPSPPSASWPDGSNTGVPAGTSLSSYTGPCTVTVANTVIDAKTVNCNLVIKAAGVTITRTKINGTVATDENSTGFSYSITDSTINAGNSPVTGVGSVNFAATRIQVTGGNRSMNCWHDATIKDSYVTGQFTDSTGVTHESGIRMGQSCVIRHNSIQCNAPDVAPDAGCSADLTGYGDFGPVQNNLIDSNLLKATTGGFCAYGGSSAGKPFSTGTNHITFTNNVFERGFNRSDKGTYTCGYYGGITSFDTAAPGNIWKNNTYSDGAALPAAN